MNPLYLVIAGKVATDPRARGHLCAEARNRVRDVPRLPRSGADRRDVGSAVPETALRLERVHRPAGDLQPLHVRAWPSIWRGGPSRPFPAPPPPPGGCFLAILVVTGISIFAATPPGAARSNSSFYVTALLTIQPRLINATIWLFVVTARLVIFFNIPVSDWHRSISLELHRLPRGVGDPAEPDEDDRMGHPGYVSFFDGSAYRGPLLLVGLVRLAEVGGHGGGPRFRSPIGGRPCLTSSSGWSRSRHSPCTSGWCDTTCAACRTRGTTS